MRRILIALIITSVMGFTSNAQSSLNNYKYVVVEKQFHFQNEPGEYNLNRLVQFLFGKYGFKAIIDGQPIPEDMKSDYCLALRSELVASGLLRTKIQIFLSDCDGNVLLMSEEGVTKVKDYDRAYEMAIRDAFEKTFPDLDYQYIPKEKSDSDSESSEKTEMVKPDPEVKPGYVVGTTDKKESSQSKPLLFARKESGRVIVTDSDKKTLMTLIPSGKEGVYLVDGKNAVVYSENGKWIYSEMIEGQSSKKELALKFQ